MKTKTLLIAAATLAVGVISSQAQVYSANIVGYVNVTIPAGQYAAICNPLDLDGVDAVTNILSGIPNSSTISLWNGSSFGTTVTKTITGKWTGATNSVIPPGVGFFIKAGGNYTNTFVGNVVASAPGTNTVAIPVGAYTFVGSIYPVSGTITNAGPNSLNLGACIPNSTTISVWSGSNYITISKLITGKWSGATNTVFNVGQGFLVKAGANTNWTQVIQ